MVISGGNFKPDTLKPKEVVSLLLDDEEIEAKCKYSYLNSTMIIMITLLYYLFSIIRYKIHRND